MTTLYKRFNEVAKRLIKKYGYTTAKIVRQVQTGKSWLNEFTQEETDINIIIVPSDKYSKESFRINGKYDYVESNYQGFIPDTGFVPTINDIIKTEKQEYSIVSVIRINPNGEEVIYKLELK